MVPRSFTFWRLTWPLCPLAEKLTTSSGDWAALSLMNCATSDNLLFQANSPSPGWTTLKGEPLKKASSKKLNGRLVVFSNETPLWGCPSGSWMTYPRKGGVLYSASRKAICILMARKEEKFKNEEKVKVATWGGRGDGVSVVCKRGRAKWSVFFMIPVKAPRIDESILPPKFPIAYTGMANPNVHRQRLLCSWVNVEIVPNGLACK